MQSISEVIAQELNARPEQIEAAVALLDEGATVPFIARYRKEVTGGLDDTQLRTLEERLAYLRELEERRETIVKSIQEQGKMTPELVLALAAADTKARLEDLYLPYRPKRRTKAQVAREAGLEPLADALLADPGLVPETAAAPYVDPDKGIEDTKAALEGARQILMERFSEDAELVGHLRDYMWENARLVSMLAEGKAESGAKFSDYFDYAESIKSVPSHRALALFRGRKEEVLNLSLVLPEPEAGTALAMGPCEQRVAARFNIQDQGRPADSWLAETARWAWRVKISLHIELDLMKRLWETAEEEAIHVFAGNLRALLLAAPAGQRPTLALDPGFRSGVKVAVVDNTGKTIDTAVIYPHEPKKQWDESIAVLAALSLRHKVELVAIGNGTASRESERLVSDLLKKHPQLKLTKVMVSEAGASVYSASEYAAKELPDLDVTLRGAVSIGRRLQDPLAELVKIEPRAIGVGQYQHDLSEAKLSRSLDAVVEDCVNAVGVDVNTASAALLARVSGLGVSLAQNVVTYRDANGGFRHRADLKNVPRLGPKAFEQAAGFLRIVGGIDPLDNSSVHPEAYPVVYRILASTKKDVKGLIGATSLLRSLAPGDFTDDNFGVPTVADILKELEKPGRDPRPEFHTATFKDGIEELKHLEPGMVLEGVVTNVANFGAFVDIGVHQDGLVHISVLANKFVKDPREVVNPGDVVRVKVLEVDLKRKRISLSMRLDETPAAKQPPGPGAAAPASRPSRGGEKSSHPSRSGETPREGEKASRPPRGGEAGRGEAGHRPPRGAERSQRQSTPQLPPPPPGGTMAEAFLRAGLDGTKKTKR
ncbi:MAG: RNA-binding transcriptional accessory protein [Alphaproteobacteria bacterium]|nr:RNA-binding transcriptional accessory protein [Alphaproteobacteria bacterium]